MLGDTVLLTITAEDNIALNWLGYRLGPPANRQDSAGQRCAGSCATIFGLPVQDSWLGTTTVTVFARDCTDLVGRCDSTETGNLTERTIGSLTVVSSIVRPTRTLPLPGWIRDAAYDAKRNVLYLSQSDSQRLGVLSLTTGSYEVLASLSSPPADIDLSLGGDSLIVALRRTPYLGVVDLRQAWPPVVDTIRLNFDTLGGRGPDRLRIAANGKALISIAHDGSGSGGSVLEYDFQTGTQRRRGDVGHFGGVSHISPLIRSGDRSRVLLVEGDACCPVVGQMYVAATDTFGSAMPVGYDFFYPPRVADADQTGDRFLIANILFDGALSPLRAFDPAAYSFEFLFGVPQAISPDGSAGYFDTRYGYVKVRMSDGAILERVRLPTGVTWFHMLPDGQTLLARTDISALFPLQPQISIVDLR